MNLEQREQQLIARQVIKILVKRFATFPEDDRTNRNAPFHEAFLSAFENKLDSFKTDTYKMISMSSWLHGLNTALGQSFFENVASVISGGEKKEWTSKRLGNLVIYQDQQDIITSIMTNLSNGTAEPSLNQEDNELEKCKKGNPVKASDVSADVFIETDKSVIGIELKTVKPNSGEMNKEKRKILEGKAGLMYKYPNKKVSFYIGFPFDPTVKTNEGEDPCSFNKVRFSNSVIGCNKHWDPQEILLGQELWDFLSERTNTMQDILSIINNIATPKFMDHFNNLRESDPDSDLLRERNTILYSWYQFEEHELMKHYENLAEHVKGKRKLSNLLNKACFDQEGNYLQERYDALSELIKD